MTNNNYHYFDMEKPNKLIARELQLKVPTRTLKAVQQSRSHGKTAFLERAVDRICGNCVCMVSIREGFNKGKHQCVVIDPKNPHAPHVHFTQPHFKCSNNKFESKYGK